MTDVSGREEELRASSENDLASLSVAEQASQLLLEVISTVSIDETEEDRTPGGYRTHALWFMAILTFRAFRAALSTISSGYEDQSVGHQRLIDELLNRSEQVQTDTSGEIAREWLEGRPRGKGSKLAGQQFWELMSGPVHANARAVFDWIAVSEEGNQTSIQVGPERRPDVADGAVTYMAGAARDVAVRLAQESGARIDTRGLDADLKAAQERFLSDQDG